MKKIFLSVVLASLLLMNFPVFSSSDKWVVVYTGYLKPGDILSVGDYTITVRQSIYGSPYIFIKKGSEWGTFFKADFGASLEYENIRVTPGSYDSEKGLFVVVNYKVTSEEHKAKPGLYFKGFEILNVTNSTVKIKYSGKILTLLANSSARIGSYLLEFTGSTVVLYELPKVVVSTSGAELVVSFPYREITVFPGETIQLPVFVTNNGSEKVTVKAGILSAPADWDVGLYYQGVEIGSMDLEGKSTLSLELRISIPQNASGVHYIKFSINDEIFTLKVKVKEPKGVEEGVKVYTPILVQEVEAGESARFPLVISTPYDANISISLHAPTNWKAYSTYQNMRVSEVSLRKGESVVFDVVVEVPRNADLGAHEIKVGIAVEGSQGSITKDITFVINVYKTYKGQKATLKLAVVDDSGMPVPKATVKIENETYGTDINGLLEVELDPGEYKVVVAKDGFEKAEEDVKLEDGEVKELKIMIRKEAYYFVVDTESDVYPITLGSVSSPFAITIENLGRNDDEYKLGISGLPSNWNAMFTQSPESTLQLTKIKVEAGKSETIYLKVYPSLNAKPGKYNITLIVRSSSGLVKEVPIKIDLTGIYQMDVNLMNYRLTITAGEERETTINIYNFGTAPITNIRISASAPKGWEVYVEPQSIPILDPKKPTSAMIRIKVPKGTPAGDYRVRITVKSDQQEWNDSIRVVVRQKSTSAYIGIFLLILAFVGVILMIRRVGRR
ncbi:COG1470 family protein [Pyrococcus kukulkanii]|uniref:NEW3 domain-containing protein n=1 Tax=Pyrococcus kukulkanii TaxID=1609559 RepID=A0ABV4T022_9EURY